MTRGGEGTKKSLRRQDSESILPVSAKTKTTRLGGFVFGN